MYNMGLFLTRQAHNLFSYVRHLSNEEQNYPYFPLGLIKLFDSQLSAVNKFSAARGNTPLNQSQNYKNPK